MTALTFQAPKFVAPAILTLALSACASAPINYFTLTPPQSAAPAKQRNADYAINVLPVKIPAQLDQRNLVVRESASQLKVLDSDRWAGPLTDEFRNALSTELSRRLGSPDVGGMDSFANARVLNIQVAIRRFDAWPGQQVRMQAVWSLDFANGTSPGKASLTCSGQFSAPAGKGYAQVVAAQQSMVGALSARIAGDARRWAANPRARCR